ncbi:MAG: hypothetical protein LBC19_16090 [Tannerella sp.]|nr:hypothetical protein [Tannerella sp.]
MKAIFILFSTFSFLGILHAQVPVPIPFSRQIWDMAVVDSDTAIKNSQNVWGALNSIATVGE